MFIKKQRFLRIFWLALPIIAGMISQNLLGLVDTAMVGKLGNSALAAVGLGGFYAILCHSLVLGISPAVQAMCSRRKGAGKEGTIATPLNAALIYVLIVSPFITIFFYYTTPEIFPYLKNDAKVITLGVPYIQARVLSIIFAGINSSFRGYFNAVDLSHIYMKNLMITHSVNIILNYLLIFGKFGFPELGVTGAGIASSISVVVGTIFYLFAGLRYARQQGFLKSFPKQAELKTLLRLSIPTSTQQFFFFGGFTVLFFILGKVGTVELAAAHVLISVTLVAILPGVALGITAATLVGQALGREDQKDAKLWGQDVVKVGFFVLGFFGIPMILCPSLILSIFIHDPHTIAIARIPMCMVGLSVIIIEPFGMVLMSALIGAGDSKRVMLVSIILQWIIYLPLIYLIGPILKYNLTTIWLFHLLVYRGGLALSYTLLWKQEKWANIKI